MAITSAIVLYCVIWAVLFFMINPLWQTSQSEDGEVVPGTPASAPDGMWAGSDGSGPPTAASPAP